MVKVHEYTSHVSCCWLQHSHVESMPCKHTDVINTEQWSGGFPSKFLIGALERQYMKGLEAGVNIVDV